MLTLSDASSLLSDYVGAGLSFTTRLNLVCDRLIKSGNWGETKQQVLFNCYPDENNAATITLPRTLQTILALAEVPPAEGCKVAKPLRIRNEWYEYYETGAGVSDNQTVQHGRGLVTQTGRFTTFATWSGPKRLRIKFETAESASGFMVFRGISDGQKLYSVINGTWGEGIPLSLTSSGVTTTQTFDEPPYAVIKPTTNGRISLYTVDALNVETLVALYDPTETAIGWRRYKVPVCSTWTAEAPGQYLAICKRAYVPLVRDFDEVVPPNIGALRFGLQALTKEDAEDYARARQLWALAEELLENEVEDETGASAEGVVQVVDDFHVSYISNGV